jgi:uncharacterized membrane protein YkvA (DUF1232 family)
MSEPSNENVPTVTDPRRLARDEARVDAGFWRKVRRTLGRVPFLEEAVAAYYCAKDSETPLRVKAVLMGALAYFVVPTDVIPDFIAALGFTDDATVFLMAAQAVRGHVTERHRVQARAALEREGTDAAPVDQSEPA